MKAKKIILSSLAVASAGALAAGVYKIAKDQKRLRTQEELVAEVREQMEAMGTIATLYVELYESNEERLVGGVIFDTFLPSCSTYEAISKKLLHM